MKPQWTLSRLPSSNRRCTVHANGPIKRLTSLDWTLATWQWVKSHTKSGRISIVIGAEGLEPEFGWPYGRIMRGAKEAGWG